MAIGAQRARASLVCRAMPLVHKTQPVPRAKAAIEGPAPGGSALANPELVWKIRFTTEKFREYSDYLDRLDFYRQRIFTCRNTGRSRLTYEEALTSEFKSSQLSKLFPEALAEPLERKLHGLQEETDEAVATIFNHLNTHYFPGEKVTLPYCAVHLDAPDRKDEIEVDVVSYDEKAATILVRKDKPESTTIDESTGDAGANGKKSGADSKKGDTVAVSVAVVVKKMSQSLTPEVILNKMVTVASHGHYRDAPWVLHEAVLMKMAKPPRLSSAAEKAMELKAPKEKKRKKRKREDAEDGKGDVDKKEGDTSEPKPRKRAKTAEGTSEESGEKGVKRGKAADEPAPAPKSKWPMEDLAIPRTYVEPPPLPPASELDASMDVDEDYVDGEEDEAAVIARLRKRHLGHPVGIDPKLLALPPRPSSDFIVPQSCLSDLLTLQTYLSAFHETLTLSPFPAEDLIMALQHPEPSPLLGEVHHRLLRHLNAHNNNLPKMSAKVWEPNLIYYLKAKLPIFGHVSLFAKLKRDGYFSLSLPQKLQLLVFIAHMVSNSRIIERPASDYPEKKANMERAAQDAQMKWKRQFKHQKANGVVKGDEDFLTAADLKEKLAMEQEKFDRDMGRLAAVRIKPLGQDRYHNTYWWYGKNAYRASFDPNAPNVSSLESFVIVEYHDGNIDESGLPPHHLDDYASDEETRIESVQYLNTALPSTSSAAYDLDDFEDVEEGGRHEEAVEYDHNGRPIRKSKMQPRARDEEDDDDEDDDGEKRHKGTSTCEICHLSTDLHKMLLCDVCDKAHHMYCLQPPLTKIPDGDWYCPVCSGGSLPPPPTALPQSFSTRAGQQRLLEIQMAAIKREEEEKKKHEEELARETRARELRAQRLAAEKAAREAAEKAAKEAAEKAATSAGETSSSIAPTAAAGVSDGAPSSATNGMDVDHAESEEKAAVAEGETPAEGASGAPAEKPKSGARSTYNHLRPAPLREKDMTKYMEPRVTNRWAYYETPEELQMLLAWLDERGIRERQLKANLKKRLPQITALMAKRVEQMKKTHSEPDLPTRRSTRHNVFERRPAQEPFMAYVNKLGEAQR